MSCKKGDTGPAGPAGPDSVMYSNWITLNMTGAVDGILAPITYTGYQYRYVVVPAKVAVTGLLHVNGLKRQDAPALAH